MPKGESGEKAGGEERISIKAEWLDEVMQGYHGPQDFEAIFKRFKKAVIERALTEIGVKSCNNALRRSARRTKKSRF